MTPPVQMAQTAERVGLATTFSGSAWTFLAENHQAIAAACSIGGLIVAAAGFVVHWIYVHKGSKRRNRRRDDA